MINKSGGLFPNTQEEFPVKQVNYFTPKNNVC